jgi:hypothetical protein
MKIHIDVIDGAHPILKMPTYPDEATIEQFFNGNKKLVVIGGEDLSENKTRVAVFYVKYQYPYLSVFLQRPETSSFGDDAVLTHFDSARYLQQPENLKEAAVNLIKRRLPESWYFA